MFEAEARQQILTLCDRVSEVIDNGDWPTEDDQAIESLILGIREALGSV